MEVLSPAKRDLGTKFLPEWIAPMLPFEAEKFFWHPDWLYEKRLKGERCLVFKRGDEVKIFSLNRRDLTSGYSRIRKSLQRQKGNFILDGSIVRSDGQQLLYVFDMLHGGDYDLTQIKLLTRKEILKILIEFDEHVRFQEHARHPSDLCWESPKKNEKLLARNMKSCYRGGLSPGWLIVPYPVTKFDWNENRKILH